MRLKELIFGKEASLAEVEGKLLVACSVCVMSSSMIGGAMIGASFETAHVTGCGAAATASLLPACICFSRGAERLNNKVDKPELEPPTAQEMQAAACSVSRKDE